MKNLILLLLIVSIGACRSSEPNLEALSKQLEEMYGGDYTAIAKEDLIELKIISEQKKDSSITSEVRPTALALQSYKYLKARGLEYEGVKVSVLLSGEESKSILFLADELNEMLLIHEVFERVTQNLKTNQYEELLVDFENEYEGEKTFDPLQKHFSAIDSTHGKILETQLLAYTFMDMDGIDSPLTKLEGIMIREKENTPVGLIFDRENQKVLAIDFTFL